MKLTKISKLLVIALALSFAAVGCKTKKPNVTQLPGGGNSGGLAGRGIDNAPGMSLPGGEGAIGQSLPGGGEAADFDPDQMNQDRAALAAETVYFAYDSSSIAPSEQSKLDAVASALKSDMSAKLLIEGNCDERGTEEYNRSLGERRALAAREALAALGVEPARVATRSYGEDRPAQDSHNEAAWSKNRRDEFVLLHAR